MTEKYFAFLGKINSYTIILSTVANVITRTCKDAFYLLNSYSIHEIENGNEDLKIFAKRVNMLIIVLAVLLLFSFLFFKVEEVEKFLQEYELCHLWGYISIFSGVFLFSFIILRLYICIPPKRKVIILKNGAEALYELLIFISLIVSSPLVILNSIIMTFFDFKMKFTVFQLWAMFILMVKMEAISLSLLFMIKTEIIDNVLNVFHESNIPWHEGAIAFSFIFFLCYIIIDSFDLLILAFIERSERSFINERLRKYNNETERREKRIKSELDLDADMVCFKGFSNIMTLSIFVVFVAVSLYASELVFPEEKEGMNYLEEGFNITSAFLPWILLILETRKKWVEKNQGSLDVT